MREGRGKRLLFVSAYFCGLVELSPHSRSSALSQPARGARSTVPAFVDVMLTGVSELVDDLVRAGSGDAHRVDPRRGRTLGLGGAGFTISWERAASEECTRNKDKHLCSSLRTFIFMDGSQLDGSDTSAGVLSAGGRRASAYLV